jgi:hypothetical protein
LAETTAREAPLDKLGTDFWAPGARWCRRVARSLGESRSARHSTPKPNDATESAIVRVKRRERRRRSHNGVFMSTPIVREEVQRLVRWEEARLVEVRPSDADEDEHLPKAFDLCQFGTDASPKSKPKAQLKLPHGAVALAIMPAVGSRSDRSVHRHADAAIGRCP